jgi:hypothetical protein
MGAFNSWVRGSFLEPPEARSAVQVALNLLEGARDHRRLRFPAPPARPGIDSAATRR